jgi:uncharacterized protein (TIGR02145 family)
VGGSNTEGKYLKATSDWEVNGNGLDTYGFAALPGSFGSINNDGEFVSGSTIGIRGNWWVSTEYNSERAYIRYMDCNVENAVWSYHDKVNMLFSVRCLKN